MKTLISFSFLCFLSFHSWSQLVEIPDESFANWLTLNFPECMDGNMMDTQCQGILETTDVICRNEGIADLEGLQYFVNMEQLQAQQNSLTSFPPLPIPNNISSMDLRYNDIQTITYLPETVFSLKLSNNENLSEISYFPDALRYLEIDNCISLLDIPDLPQPNMTRFSRKSTPQLPLQVLPLSLSHYFIANCELSDIPELPEFILTLDISNNDIGNQESLFISEYILNLDVSNTGMTELPELPSTLTHFSASFNEISALPELPENLQSLEVYQNSLTSLDLPTSIVSLFAGECQLESITPNYLPNCTQYLVSVNNLTEANKTAENMVMYTIFDNNISCLEWLPESIDIFSVGDNPLTCIPSLPVYIMADQDMNNFPICVLDDPVNNPFGCEPTIGFEGYVYLDQDENCDYNENSLTNIPIKIGLDGLGFGITNSVSNGRYTHQNEFGDYQLDVDAVNVPFENNCDFHEFTLDVNNQYYSDLNFSLSCEFEDDFGIQSVVPTGWAFPGQYHVAKIFAGELSQFYNVHCSGPASGEVLISMEGPAVILGVSEGGPEPSSISDTQVSFEVEDFTAIDLMDYFELDMYTLTTATDEDEICFAVQLISSSNDPITENNYLTFCYPIVNSYDPNNKLVSPMTVEPGFEGWMHYTINFQNTGSAPAFNIRLEDELPQNVDVETFQMTNTSHDSYFELVNHNLTIYYPDIMLADSTINEPDSKGYFQFKIHTSEPLELGENIENTASIFFDYNDPIITNTAITTAETTNNITEWASFSNLSIYPNPSNGHVSIRSREDIISISCLDLLGKEIDFDFEKNNSETILHLNWHTGLILVEIETTKGFIKKKLVLE